MDLVAVQPQQDLLRLREVAPVDDATVVDAPRRPLHLQLVPQVGRQVAQEDLKEGDGYMNGSANALGASLPLSLFLSPLLPFESGAAIVLPPEIYDGSTLRWQIAG